MNVHDHAYPFTLERWSRGFRAPYEAVGGSLNQILARALFRAAVEHEPGGWWRLRHGARVLAQWPEG
ncbi:MAG: hypothetical protein KDJ90_00280 [Nitratireductor sp.]|nr:hypothetical protein [Nitratireductor sp.]